MAMVKGFPAKEVVYIQKALKSTVGVRIMCARKLVCRTAATLYSTRAAFYTTYQQLCSDNQGSEDETTSKDEVEKDKVGV